jgi:hypothetical protein
MTAIEKSVGDGLQLTEFSRAPLFYSLFCTVFHRMFGLPHSEIKTPKRSLTEEDSSGLLNAVAKLSEVIATAKEEEGAIPSAYTRFVTACLRQTDNIEPRKTRLAVLYREAFS